MDREEREFLNLLSEKRHRELITTLSNLSVKASIPEGLEKLITKLSTSSPSENIPAGAIAISKTIVKKLESIDKRLSNISGVGAEWIFKVNKNPMGELDTIKATRTK